jgi:hypothetical protein
MEGSDRELIEVLCWYMPGGTEKDDENSLRIACVPTEIRTENHLNTSLKRYRYTDLLVII